MEYLVDKELAAWSHLVAPCPDGHQSQEMFRGQYWTGTLLQLCQGHEQWD